MCLMTDPCMSQFDHTTAIDYAQQAGHDDVVQALKEAGAGDRGG